MTNEFQAVVAELGGRQALGRELTTDHDLREASAKVSRLLWWIR